MYDHLEIRCPRLGSEVTFAYCETEGGNHPCSRILTCWQPYFSVETYLREKLNQEEWDRLQNPESKHKVTTLVELIEAAKKRRGLSD